MKKDIPTFLITAIYIVLNLNSFSQKWEPEVISSQDTLLVSPRTENNAKMAIDSLQHKPEKVLKYATRSWEGIRFDIGFSNYYLNNKTQQWLGKNAGIHFNFSLAIKNINLGLRFKPLTITPQKEMAFRSQTVTQEADLNHIRLDYYLSYSFDYDWLISVEPYLGYNQTRFLVINEDELKQEFSFKSTGGPIIGVSINKYFMIKKYNYLSIFGSLGYGFVNYRKVHPDLGFGYFEWNIGIAYKAFSKGITLKMADQVLYSI